MRPIVKSDVMSSGEYECARDALRRRMLVVKSKRRVPIGPIATLHFENRETMLYQVHEMLRAEGSWGRLGAIEEELAAYNPIVPAELEVSGTLMFEIDSAPERALWLRDLVGIEKHLWLRVCEGGPISATFDGSQIADDRISSVQYVKWKLGREEADKLRHGGSVVKLFIDHPRYVHESVLSEETRRELAGDVGLENRE